jgi:hypothetical protein
MLEIQISLSYLGADFAPINPRSYSRSTPREPTKPPCLTIRLLRREPDGELVLTEYDDKVILPYAILSHTSTTDNSEEVNF